MSFRLVVPVREHFYKPTHDADTGCDCLCSIRMDIERVQLYYDQDDESSGTRSNSHDVHERLSKTKNYGLL